MTIKVFIGFDKREPVAFSTLSYSIQVRASQPVSITPIMLSQLNGIFWRAKDPLQSTDFSFSRFLTPYLSGYKGWSIFMDCDMLMLDDIVKLWDLRNEEYAVQVVKHKHVPNESSKFLNMPQSRYEKKNWSSVMLFNNERCRQLTPDYVNTASGLELHQFKWLSDEGLIGELPPAWNHLVGVQQSTGDESLLHYTLGGPYFDEYRHCEFASHWFEEKQKINYAEQCKTSQLKIV
ncbi:MAG: glycosyltransferase [Gammaproteobacteria bacterium]|nr:glycosyltransferase [Gammaproteobacteria bacterium]